VYWLFSVKLGRRLTWPWAWPTEPCRRWRPRRRSTPEVPWPHLIAGQALLAKGDAAAAVAPLLASLAANPFDPSVHCSLAEAYKKLPTDAATTSKRQRSRTRLPGAQPLASLRLHVSGRGRRTERGMALLPSS